MQASNSIRDDDRTQLGITCKKQLQSSKDANPKTCQNATACILQICSVPGALSTGTELTPGPID